MSKVFAPFIQRKHDIESKVVTKGGENMEIIIPMSLSKKTNSLKELVCTECQICQDPKSFISNDNNASSRHSFCSGKLFDSLLEVLMKTHTNLVLKCPIFG